MKSILKIVGGVAVLVLVYWLGKNTNDAVNEKQVRNIVNTSFEECMADNVVREEKLNQHITEIGQLEEDIALTEELSQTKGEVVYGMMLTLFNEWHQTLQLEKRQPGAN